jgi:hypothetical protein
MFSDIQSLSATGTEQIFFCSYASVSFNWQYFVSGKMSGTECINKVKDAKSV